MRVRPEIRWPQGEIRMLNHHSEVLRDNPWQDPASRELAVYLPPGYEGSGEPLPVLWDLAAFTNSGLGHLGWRHHGETLPQRLDRLIAEDKMPPVVVVMPDCYTSLGGNQYVDSPAVGMYASYLCDELIPFVSEHLNVLTGPEHRGAFGKSSGGYGAIMLAITRPGVFGAIASHAGDVGFELVYRPEFPLAASQLLRVNGDVDEFLRRFWRRRNRGKADYATLMTIAMAASYDPDEQDVSNIRMPFDLLSGALVEERWACWLKWDPLNLVKEHAQALDQLRCLYLDAGNRDQYHIQFGTRAFSALLEKRNISHHFEEFDGTHSGLDWRLDTSLPLIANAVSAA